MISADLSATRGPSCTAYWGSVFPSFGETRLANRGAESSSGLSGDAAGDSDARLS